MITKITMNEVASYRHPVCLETDKKTNLIYGLNGTGKSTFSNYLYNTKNEEYTYCSVDGLADDELLVYNQSFIFDNFYESDTLKGIFTLSKENKSAKQAIDDDYLELTGAPSARIKILLSHYIFVCAEGAPVDFK